MATVTDCKLRCELDEAAGVYGSGRGTSSVGVRCELDDAAALMHEVVWRRDGHLSELAAVR